MHQEHAMLISYTDLLGYRIGATDGVIGRVRDCYFDEATWTIRYLVADTGVAKLMRRVLLAPSTVATFDRSRQVVSTHLSMRQVTESPDWSMEMPISRQIEAAYRAHFGWGQWWENRIRTEQAMLPGDMAVVRTIVASAEDDDRPHLRSCHEITSYSLHAAGGHVGNVVDVLMDDRTWQMDAIIFRIGIEHRMLKAAHLQQVRWLDGAVYSDATADFLAVSPDYPI